MLYESEHGARAPHAHIATQQVDKYQVHLPGCAKIFISAVKGLAVYLLPNEAQNVEYSTIGFRASVTPG